MIKLANKMLEISQQLHALTNIGESVSIPIANLDRSASDMSNIPTWCCDFKKTDDGYLLHFGHYKRQDWAPLRSQWSTAHNRDHSESQWRARNTIFAQEAILCPIESVDSFTHVCT